MTQLVLHDYFRSSASYRVRIALNLKGLAYERVEVSLIAGEQRSDAYLELNAQGFVPLLIADGETIIQSLAIIDWLDRAFPEPRLIPEEAMPRAVALAQAQVVASDIHPLNNLRVLQFFEHTWNVPQAEREAWVRHWIQAGFEALETTLCDNPSTGTYCDGEVPTMADCCLVPQVYNASRFGVDMAPYRTLRRINEACLALEAFDAARPENQPDAPAAC